MSQDLPAIGAAVIPKLESLPLIAQAQQKVFAILFFQRQTIILAHSSLEILVIMRQKPFLNVLTS
jgi:hypothetical protein